MATQSVDFFIAMEDSEPLRLAPTVASLENPSDPSQDPLPSAFIGPRDCRGPTNHMSPKQIIITVPTKDIRTLSIGKSKR